MPTGKLREERKLIYREENAKLLEDFLKSLKVANGSPRTIVAYRHNIEDFLDFPLGLNVTDWTPIFDLRNADWMRNGFRFPGVRP